MSGWGGEVPSTSSHYVRTKEWDARKPYRFRLLAEPVQGFVGWNKDKKPVRRLRQAEFKPGEVVVDDDNQISFFRAAPVWDYQLKRVRLWEIRQSGILGALRNYALNPDFGDPQGYDVSVTKDPGPPIRYSVIASPPKPLVPEAQAEWTQVLGAGFDLSQLFTGGDPFNGWMPEAGDDGVTVDGERIPF